MRLGVLFSAVLALAAFGFCADQPDTLLLPCPQGSPAAPGCNPSKNELRDARNAFAKGLKLQREKRLDEAFEQFETAARIAPRDVEYVTAKEMARQQLVFDHLARGNTELAKGRQWEALPGFRTALGLHPQTDFAQDRRREAEARHSPALPEGPGGSA